MRRMTKQRGKPRTTRRTRRAPRRRRNDLVRRTLRLAPRALLISAAIAAPIALWQTGLIGQMATGLHDGLLRLTAVAGLRVEEIVIEGQQRASKPDLQRSLGVGKGDPLFSFDPNAAKQRVEALGWVKQAVVERRLPNQIVLHLVERQPFALWQHDGRFVLVDAGGVPITGRGLAAHTNLLHIVGPEAPKHAKALHTALSTEPELMQRVQSATWVGGRRWDVYLQGGIVIRLPEREPARAWRQLARYAAEHRLLAKEIKAVDLRVDGRLVLTPAADANTAVAAGKSS